MTVRKTRREDFPAVLKIYEDCRAVMHGRGLQQWLNGYPGEKELEADCAAGTSYVLTDGDRVAGCAAVLLTGEPSYARIAGSWRTEGPYAAIHRVGVDPALHGKGIGADFLRALERIAARAGMPSVRIDTHHDNAPMRRTLLSLGFAECGVIRLEDGSPRVAYERLLSEPVVRPAVLRDRSLYLTLAEEFYGSDAVLSPIPAAFHERNFDEILRPEGQLRAYLFEAEGKPAGFAQFSLNWSTEAGGRTIWIEDVYVRKDFRGHGIGSAFFRRLEFDYGASAHRYRLEVEEDNGAARRLYERLGYRVLPYLQMYRDV